MIRLLFGLLLVLRVLVRGAKRLKSVTALLTLPAMMTPEKVNPIWRAHDSRSRSLSQRRMHSARMLLIGSLLMVVEGW